MGNNKKRSRKDRKDGYFVKNQDPLHVMMPFLMPKRVDNEAVLTEEVDITNLNAFIEKKNGENPQYKYTMFHVIVAALAKTLKLRPCMNRFYKNNLLYDRKFISFSFVAKEKFKDNGREAILVLKYKDESPYSSPLEQIHEEICKRVYSVKKEYKEDPTTKDLKLLVKMPTPIVSLIMNFMRWLDEKGHYPESLANNDPDFASVFITNLGSIKMNANYHHLANWGTNSFFTVIGEKQIKPIFANDGSYEMKPILPISITIDERIADGLYFSRSIRLFKYLLTHPELLERPIEEEVNYEG